MTRRIRAAIVATVIGTLVVAGVATLLIARFQARAATQDVLREQAESLVLAAAQPDGDATARQQVAARRVLRDLRRALQVEGIEFVLVDTAGQVQGTLPDGVDVADLDVDALRNGETISGADGSLVWAAAPLVRPRTTVVAVVTQEATAGLGRVLPWFLFAGALTIGIGSTVAVVLGRRLARPVDAAAAAAHRIAAGELSVRLPEPTATDRDELAELTRSINHLAAALERSRTLEQQFLLSISHDLRTPLTSVRGYAEAIADGAAPDAASAAGVILTETRRLERLIGDVLDLAHLDGRSFSLQPVELDLRAAAVDASAAAGPAALAHGIEIAVDRGPPVTVQADPVRVGQVLANLLENATKYARSQITLRVDVDGAAAVLQVDDDGPGIAPDDRPHVFERLYVARHRPVRAEVGSGLGLAIVRQLTEAMGGSVAAGSSASGGARIEVRLPIAHTSLTSTG